jgi:hypothetical protein
MDDVAKKLSDEWKTRHFESSEEAFKKAEEGFVRSSGPSFFQKAESEEPKQEMAFAGGLKKLFQ